MHIAICDSQRHVYSQSSEIRKIGFVNSVGKQSFLELSEKQYPMTTRKFLCKFNPAQFLNAILKTLNNSIPYTENSHDSGS